MSSDDAARDLPTGDGANSKHVVMEQLGHSTLATTTRYMHVVPQLKTDAAAAMDRALGS